MFERIERMASSSEKSCKTAADETSDDKGV